MSNLLTSCTNWLTLFLVCIYRPEENHMLSSGGGSGGGGWWGLDSIDADCARSPVDPAVPCRIAPDQAVDTNPEATLRLG